MKNITIQGFGCKIKEEKFKRMTGEFYTPKIWVDEAHKMIKDQFGPNWKEEYVVWDPAWGTGNLTRDFKFKELYCSTLNHGDLQVGQYYNPEAIKFQYDFLNDDVTPEGLLPMDNIKKMPDGLVQVFKKNKPIIILMNPPYAKSSGGSNRGTTGAKSGLADNLMNNQMLNEKMGKVSAQLYCQFLFRCIKFSRMYKNNITIATFTPPLFMTGSSYRNFRKEYFNYYSYINGFLFNAGDFANVSSTWGISFTIWNTKKKDIQETFKVDLKKMNSDYIIYNIDEKMLYNIDSNIPCNVWAKTTEAKLIREDCPQLSNPINIKPNGGGRIFPESIGYMNCNGNNIYYNQSLVGLYTSGFSGGGTGNGHSPGFPIINENFYKSISLFTARKTITSNWINQKDEYLAPNEQHPEYPQWNTDTIIYSLFNNSSNQSSLRQITYKNKLWDIKNEWFWMPNDQMLQLANENGFDELYHDATGDHDRFVFNKIQESSFSEDASAVLNKAIELVIKTFPYRKALHEEHPEWHLNTWDAGWYQIKKILKLYFKDDLKEFNLLYKSFENRMREGVYKFGFLK